MILEDYSAARSVQAPPCLPGWRGGRVEVPKRRHYDRYSVRKTELRTVSILNFARSAFARSSVKVLLRRGLQPMTIAAAKYAAGKGAGMFVFFDEHFAIDDSHFDTSRFLNEAFLVGG